MDRSVATGSHGIGAVRAPVGSCAIAPMRCSPRAQTRPTSNTMITDRRLRRIAGLTVGLMGAGAVCGALAGAAALIISLWLEHDPWSFDLGLVVGPIFGAPIGAITAPILAWLLLRRVALGEMFVRLSAGTT